MKRDYSFNQMSQQGLGHLEPKLKMGSQPYYTGCKQSRDNWTDMRVEEIKKKYDTPSHRQIGSYLQPQDRARDPAENNSSNIYSSSYRHVLKESMTSSNLLRREEGLSPNMSIPSFKEESMRKSTWQDNEPVYRHSYENEKQNNSFMEKFTNIKNSMKIEDRHADRNRYADRDPVKDRMVDREYLKEKERSVQRDHVKQRVAEREPVKYREYPSSKVVPRVQHIDEINMKIKRILECLNEENSSKCEQKTQNKSSFLKGSIMSKSGEELEETKILSRQKVSYEREEPKESTVDKERYSLSPQTRNNGSTRWRLEDKYKEMKESSFLNNSLVKKTEEKGEEDSNSWFEAQPSKVRESRDNRSRSCLGTFKNEEMKLNSGKKVDDEISKINNRIREFEEEKKKLNIDFKPYNYEMKYNRSSSNLADHKSYRFSRPPRPNRTPDSSISKSFHQVPEKLRTEADEYPARPSYGEVRKSLHLNFNYQQSRENNQNQGMLTFQASEHKQNVKEEAFDSEEVLPKFKEIQPETEAINSNPQPDQAEEELKLKAEEGIEERKRKLLDTATVSFSRETKRLIENLFEQVKLDEDLRNAKIWYRDLLDSDKEQALRAEAQKYGLRFEKLQFLVTDEEDNPFYSVRESDQSYVCLIEREIKAQNYWNQNIAGQFDLREFEVEKFTAEKVDLEKKGFFEVEDLVRFINMETGTFYRNRDLILVFRRITNESKLQWQQFLQVLAQRN